MGLAGFIETATNDVHKPSYSEEYENRMGFIVDKFVLSEPSDMGHILLVSVDPSTHRNQYPTSVQ